MKIGDSNLWFGYGRGKEAPPQPFQRGEAYEIAGLRQEILTPFTKETDYKSKA